MSFHELEIRMKDVISKFETGTEFRLSDIILHPPAGLGRILYESVESGEIPNVECIGKRNGVDWYKKI